ncbi:ATP-binding protein [Haloplanus rallus]|uniref:ATP-binding protein n=1 Tax=Haloplanus rallus TaxID=1816183 RepID=A0A6B9FDD1_9EURY|nr:AAA family ATPase [Haloplanus rallus]QGX93969.1 ATP-binding protein [Haloplanus rallus]
MERVRRLLDSADASEEDAEKGGSPEFVREYNLTEVDWREFWERIYIDEQDKDKIINYGLLEQQLQAADFEQMTLSRHGAVLLSGPPGTGKTTLAKGAADELARNLDRDRLGIEEVIFKQIAVRHLFSSDHGDSPKLVEEAFDAVVADAEGGNAYQIVLLDEVESLFSNRQDLTETDPMDAIRAVNTALDALDTVAELNNVYVIATSNQPNAVDSAFLDRTDEQIFIGNPAPEHRRRILEDIFARLRETFDTQLSATGSEMDRLVELSSGFSGRRMRKSVLSALARNQSTVKDPGELSVGHLIEEFEHKKSMLQDADNEYVRLGGNPEQNQ